MGRVLNPTLLPITGAAEEGRSIRTKITTAIHTENYKV
jgi:hypothetical protein